MTPSLSDIRARHFGWALAISTVVGAVVAGQQLGFEVAILVLAAGALVLVIALLWASVAGLSGDTPLTLDEAIGMGAPSAEEEQKRAVLRALKDLEYERSVGKLTDADYREFSERYRAEARRLIEAVDATLGPAHELAEKLAHERLEKAGLAGADAEPGEAAGADAADAKESADAESTDADRTKEGAESDAEPARGEPAKKDESTKLKPAKSPDSEAVAAVPQESDS